MMSNRDETPENEEKGRPTSEPFDPSNLHQTLGWLQAARGGDTESFARLYEHIAPALFTWAELRLRPNQRLYVEPQDVVQEVWFRAWRSLDRYDPNNAPFRLWIFRVAKNVLLEAFRQLRKADRAGGGAGPSTKLFALQNLPDSATSISRRMARDENLRAFAERVRTLPEEEQKLVLFCGLEGLSYKEVGERMDISPEAAAKRWQRLRARLGESGLPKDLLATNP